MSLFSEFEKTIDRGFRRWTEKMFGPAESSQLLLVHRAILEELEGKVQVVSHGRRMFPFPRVTVTLISADAERRALYQAAFGGEDRLEKDVRESLEGAQCEVPRGFAVEVKTSESGGGNFQIAYGVSARETPVAPPAGAGRLVVVKGKTAQSEYPLEKNRINIGRLAELTDSEQRVVRRNDVVFEEGSDEAAGTVSRKHAHIRREEGEYRICDDGSEFGTRVFRDGRSIEVPAGNRRGEKLRAGDEIYLGRACLRFEQ
ncbi:MAG: FHA domain-containing protein [Candidatus Sulfopaludibacter sp.]|nr:FHA domain-containing protein [Candidatus Sulfopaludibacter sp.]